MTTWLSKQKKGELQALAKHADIAGRDNMLKDDLVVTLDQHLRENSTKYAGDKLFSEFYERSGSPVKKAARASASEAPEGEKAAPKRRKTIAKEATSPETSSTALVPRTPASLQRLASRVRLPASPAVSQAVQAQTSRISNVYKSTLKKYDIKKRLSTARQELSSVEAINLIILIVEAFGLRRVVFPYNRHFTLGTRKWENIYIPTFSALTTNEFWAPVSLWALTSLVLPTLAGYFFNLTYTNPRPRTRRTAPLREIDPLTANIVKALLVWTVYTNGSQVAQYFNYNDATVQAVASSIYGGYVSLLIGAGIGILTGLHDTLSYKS